MSKGKKSEIGDENVAANGYHYVKTSTGWRLKHHLVAEQVLKRPLEDNERVSFRDSDRDNFAPDNIVVTLKGSTKSNGLSKRLTTIEEKMQEYVEDHADRSQALQDLKDALSDVRSMYGFAVLA